VTAPSDPVLPPRWGALPNSLTLGALGLLMWGVVSGVPGTDSGGEKLAAWVLLAVASAAWVGWVLVRNAGSQVIVASTVVAMALAGGALAALVPVATVFPAVAAVSAASRWAMPPSVAVGAGGWLAVLVSVEATGRPGGVVLGSLAAVFAGLVVGLTRRQAVERTEQATRLELASERAEVERNRAELLAERNHLARELHDVLAHTLAALSLQLEAFATVVDAEPHVSPAVHDQLERTRQLVREGLDEARGAVRALRDEATPLPERLATLSAQHGAAFSASGPVRSLPPEAVLALYRTAQEALTNVMKHAQGAAVAVRLAYDDTGAVTVTVDDSGGATAAGRSALGATGAGFGLRGIGERLALLGGHMEAGPTPDGWRVSASVPAPAPTGRARDPLAS